MTTAAPTPNIYGLNMLPTFAHLIDGALENATGLLKSLKEADARDHPVLTEHDLDRFFRIFEDEAIHIAYYATQLDVWRKLDPSPEQLAEITRLDAKLAPIAKTSEEGRVLACNLRDRRHTLEGFMEKSDAELGLEFLLRMMQPH